MSTWLALGSANIALAVVFGKKAYSKNNKEIQSKDNEDN